MQSVHTWCDELELGHEAGRFDPRWREEHRHVKESETGTWAEHAQLHSSVWKEELKHRHKRNMLYVFVVVSSPFRVKPGTVGFFLPFKNSMEDIV